MDRCISSDINNMLLRYSYMLDIKMDCRNDPNINDSCKSTPSQKEIIWNQRKQKYIDAYSFAVILTKLTLSFSLILYIINKYTNISSYLDNNRFNDAIYRAVSILRSLNNIRSSKYILLYIIIENCVGGIIMFLLCSFC